MSAATFITIHGRPTPAMPFDGDWLIKGTIVDHLTEVDRCLDVIELDSWSSTGADWDRHGYYREIRAALDEFWPGWDKRIELPPDPPSDDDTLGQ